MREEFAADSHNGSAGGESGELDFYRLYLEEMASIPPCTAQEEERLLTALVSGDESAKKRLAEGNLFLAVKLAGEYGDSGIPAGDRIQEANMALLLFLEEAKGGFSGDFHSEMEKRIRGAIEAACEEQRREEEIGEEMAARVNVLKDISAEMAKELGREATVDELAGRMKMSADEIKDIMKLTLDAMSIGGGVAGELAGGEFTDGDGVR